MANSRAAKMIALTSAARGRSNLIPGEAKIIAKKAQIMSRNEKAKPLARAMQKRKVLDMY